MKIKEIINYFGLWLDEYKPFPLGYQEQKYINTNEKKLKIHKALLVSLEIKEEDRLSIIENKTSQIISYAGIILSAVSLFIPILLGKITEQSELFRILFIVILAIVFLFYFLTIHNALRNYNIGKYRYSRSDPKNVIAIQAKSSNEFIKVEIQDLLYSYELNTKTNNEKANNLIYSYRAFKIAIMFTALMGLMLCVSLLFTNTNKVSNSQGPINIQNIYSPSVIDSGANANNPKLLNLKIHVNEKGKIDSAGIRNTIKRSISP